MSNSNTFEILLRTMGGAEAAKVFSQVQASAASVSSAVMGIHGSMKMVAGTLAASGAIAMVREMWTAAQESRVAQFQLEAALQAAGQASKDFIEQLSAQADMLQKVTGVSDETILATDRILLSLGATAEQVAALAPLVLDVAAAMGTDATSAARLLGSALDGQSVQLGRLNIEAKNFDDLLVKLKQRFEGQSEALMAAKGPTAALSIAWGDLIENMGEIAAVTFTPLLEEINRLSDAIGRLTGTGTWASFWEAIPDWAKNSPFQAWSKTLRQALDAINGPGAPPAAGLPQPRGNKVGTSFLDDGSRFDQEEEDIKAERLRQIADADSLRQVQGDLNNLYAFRKALIESDPLMGEAARQEALLQAMRDELPVLQQREDLLRAEYDRQLRADPVRVLETTIAAEKELGDAQLERLKIQNQITALSLREIEIKEQARGMSYVGSTASRFENFQASSRFDDEQGIGAGAMAGIQTSLIEMGSTAQQVGQAITTSIGGALSGISTSIGGLIRGTMTWSEAFYNVGEAILDAVISAFSQMITQMVLSFALQRLFGAAAQTQAAILGTAWSTAAISASIATMGTAATVGASAFLAAQAVGAAASAPLYGPGFVVGGYTGDGPATQIAGPVHRGEWVVPAWRTAQIGLPALEALTFGSETEMARRELPTQVVIVDDRRDVDHLRRDPRFKTLVIDLLQQA